MDPIKDGLNPYYVGRCSVSGINTNKYKYQIQVLILIMLEDALWELCHLVKDGDEEGLNPYYVGRCSVRKYILTL